MPVIAPAGDRVRKLRAIGDTRDPLAVRLALERSLNAGRLHPSSVSRDAIVCVRRLRVAVTHFGSNKWEETADRQLKSMLANVSHPYNESVPANSPVVSFADTAELLACMARDWLSGEGDSWWWRSIVGAPLSYSVVQQALSEKPTAIPAAIELLAKAGMATRFVNAMTDEWCGDVCTDVALHFAVPDPVPAESSLVSNRSCGTTASHDSVTDLAMRVRVVVAPIDGYDDLSDRRRLLIGVALILRKAPEIARRAGIGAALLSRQQSVAALFERPLGTDTGKLHGRQYPTGDGPIESVSATDSSLDDRSAAATRNELPAGQANVPHSTDLERVEGSPQSAESNRVAGMTCNASIGAETREIEKQDFGRAIHIDSSFAGVLYLVNVALHLGLYGDFTQPRRPGLALSLWDFLALVGRGACGAELERDPLWDMLAELSGWDSGYGTHRYEPETTCDVDDAAIIAAVTGTTDPADDWLQRLSSTLEARIARALDVPEGQALAFLCARPGRVSLSDSRLETVFALATHPLAIRVAGLDRNPGWVPAAGRVIEFRYE